MKTSRLHLKKRRILQRVGQDDLQKEMTLYRTGKLGLAFLVPAQRFRKSTVQQLFHTRAAR